MNTTKIDEIYSDNNVALKRSILMDMLNGVLSSPRKESSAELWKMYIDAALDQLDESVYKPLIEALTTQALQELKDELPEKKPNALKPGGLVISEDGKTVETRYLTQASSGGYNQAITEVTNIIDNKIKGE